MSKQRDEWYAICELVVGPKYVGFFSPRWDSEKIVPTVYIWNESRFKKHARRVLAEPDENFPEPEVMWLYVPGTDSAYSAMDAVNKKHRLGRPGLGWSYSPGQKAMCTLDPRLLDNTEGLVKLLSDQFRPHEFWPTMPKKGRAAVLAGLKRLEHPSIVHERVQDAKWQERPSWRDKLYKNN